jgi:hypothetical protein
MPGSRAFTRSKKVYRTNAQEPTPHTIKHARRAAPTPIVKKDLLFEVEKVVNARVGKWGLEYFVKWRGYHVSENSWIDEVPPFFQKNSQFY